MPVFKPAPTCRNCGKTLLTPLDEGRQGRQRKYCNTTCARQFRATAQKMIKAGLDEPPEDPNQAERGHAMTPYVRAMRQLAFNSGIEDEIRETLREEVRSQVKQHLKDNILGGVEALTALLPDVILRLGDDLRSEDWMRSARAQSLVLKYTAAFKETEATEGSSRSIHIYHGVPVPDTKMGERMRITIAQAEGDDDDVVEAPVESFETDWPMCQECAQRKHPDTFATLTEAGDKGYCRSCHYQRTIRRQMSKPEDATGAAGDNTLGAADRGKLGPLDRDM